MMKPSIHKIPHLQSPKTTNLHYQTLNFVLFFLVVVVFVLLNTIDMSVYAYSIFYPLDNELSID